MQSKPLLQLLADLIEGWIGICSFVEEWCVRVDFWVVVDIVDAVDAGSWGWIGFVGRDDVCWDVEVWPEIGGCWVWNEGIACIRSETDTAKIHLFVGVEVSIVRVVALIGISLPNASLIGVVALIGIVSLIRVVALVVVRRWRNVGIVALIAVWISLISIRVALVSLIVFVLHLLIQSLSEVVEARIRRNGGH